MIATRRDRVDLVNEIAMRRENLNKRKVKKTPTVKWLFPVPVSRQYQRILDRHVENMIALTIQIVVNNLESLTAQRDLEFPELLKTDAFEESADRVINSLQLGIASQPLGKVLTAEEIGQETSVWNDAQWQKTMKNVMGVAIFQQEPWLGPVLNGFTKENVQLITKLEQDYLADVSGIVQRGLRQGDSHRTIATRLLGDARLASGLRSGIVQFEQRGKKFPIKGKDLASKTKNRAKLIARDQVSKLNGQLTKLRETNLGIQKYTWRTAQDERVRPTHRANNGKVFNWDESPANTGHPGDDVQCRCHAEPIFDDIIEGILQNG